MREFCDLNVTEKPYYAENLANVKQLLMLGYHTIALTRHYKLPTKEQKKKIKGAAAAANKEQTKQTQQYIAGMKALHDRLKSDVEKLKQSSTATSKQTLEVIVPNNFRLLSRLTFDVTEMDQLTHFRTPNIKLLLDNFDLIAISPKSEKIFTSLMSGKLDCDILAFPMEHKPDFQVSRQMIGLGFRRGIVLEILYSGAIRSQSLRRYVFMNAQLLVSRTKHAKGVIVSSGGGDSVMDFRSPQDVANLSNLFGLTGQSCLDAVSTTGVKCVDHATLRKQTFKGAVKIEQVSELEEQHQFEGDEQEGPVSKKQKMSS